MKFSKFVFLFEEQSYYICFNSVYGKIIKLGKGNFNGNEIEPKRLTEEQLKYLKYYHFIVDSDKEDQKIVEKCYRNRTNKRTLYITIEITTNCNFNCAFCYQHHWNCRSKIEMSDIKKLITIIQSSNLTKYDEINIDFIGGEPFLYKESVLDIYREFKFLCKKNNICLSVKLNTNGYFLDTNTLNEFENTVIMLPFLAPSDYGSIVKLKSSKNNTPLYQLLFEKISNWVSTLNQNNTILLTFRYNVNHLNVDYIPTFFETISSFGIMNYEVAFVNTANIGGDFHNELSDTEFMDIYFDKVMPLCKKYGIKFPMKPRCEVSRCKARHTGSLKLFANGKVGLCNGIFCEENMPHITSVSRLEDIDEFYSKIKGYNYYTDESKCQNCRYVFLCGGPSPCVNHRCPIDLNNLKRYIYSII